MQAATSSTSAANSSSSSSVGTAKTPRSSAISPNSTTPLLKSKFVDPTNDQDIEEISKKISEHADALYRNWKSRGLKPNDFFEFYNNPESGIAVADLLSNEQVGMNNTEGLQKLVSNFVSKDKEQRGVKHAVNSGGGNASAAAVKLTAKSASVTANKERPSSPKLRSSSPTSTAANSMSQRPGGAAMLHTSASASSSPSPSSSTASSRAVIQSNSSSMLVTTDSSSSTIKKLTKTSVNTLKTSSSSIASTKNEELKMGQQKVSTSTKSSLGAPALSGKKEKSANEIKSSNKAESKKSTNRAASPTFTDANSKLSMEVDLNLNELTQLQTQNLLKISELLAQEANKGQAATSKSSKIVVKEKEKLKKVVPQQQQQQQQSEPHVAANDAKLTASTAKVIKRIETGAAVANVDKKIANKIVNGAAGACGSMGEDAIDAKLTTPNRATSPSKSPNSDKSNKQVKRAATTKSATSSLSAAGVVKSNARSAANVVAASTTAASAVAAVDIAESLEKLQNIGKPTANVSSDSKAATKSSSKVLKSSKEINGAVNNSASTATLDCKQKPPENISSSHKSNSTTVSEQVMEVGRTSMPSPTKYNKRPGALGLVTGLDKNLGRPILTRGSVAERVMLFEKCPDVRNAFLNIKRPDPTDINPPKSLLKAKLHATPPSQPSERNAIQKEFRNTRSVYIPRFYFPHGKPQPTIAMERTLRGILSAFDSFPNNQVTKDELPRILKLCGLPFYWRMPVLLFCQQSNTMGLVERVRFVEFWKQMNVYCHDAASRFVYILSRGQRYRSYILPEDLAPLVQDVVDTHPGLAFLKEATEFHSRYVHTVIARIFYSVNRCWSGRINISELKKSDLLEIITLLEEEEDINQIMAFFSYEHFYVIYCKFWELDKDHDLLINQDDLARHSDHALSTRIVERIFSGCVTRSDNKKHPEDEAKMSYTDFVWFILSEEDKRTPTAIEYWFRCMDVDGDGVLSMYELEYFYEEQQQRMESIGIESLPFEDCLCQMLDMIKPQNRDCITLSDLKRCKMTHVFFDTFFNLEKYLDHEQRDPFASQRDDYASDWDRFAAQEYELLITEEND